MPARDGHSRGGVVPTIVDLAPAAGWDEREAHDLYSIGFDGHEPLRPLVDHDLVLAHWTVAVRGHGPYQVAVGPIHAGVIESGHFRFHVVGDRILHLDARLFYKHRGLERAAEGATLAGGAAFVARACAACAVSNGVAYAHACEDALGLTPPRSSPGRERSCSSSSAAGATSTTSAPSAPASGSQPAPTASSASANGCGGSTPRSPGIATSSAPCGRREPLALDADAIRSTRDELENVAAEAAGAWREILFNASFEDRLPDIGVVGAEDVARARHRRARCPRRGCHRRRPHRRHTPHLQRLHSRRARTCGRRRAGTSRAARPRALAVVRPPQATPRRPARPLPARTAGRAPTSPPAASRVPAAPHCALSNATETASTGSGSEPAPTQTGPRSHTPPPRTCFPTSRSSTRASSSATPAPTADADPTPRPPTTPTHPGIPAPDRGRSLAIRHVDAGSCNGCEHELTITSSPYYDLQHFGLGIVASPRHADVLLITGPVTTRMREPLLTAYAAMPEPRLVAALGNCALGCGLLGPPERSSAQSTTSSPSTCGSPAAHPPPKRSPRLCSSFAPRAWGGGRPRTSADWSRSPAAAGAPRCLVPSRPQGVGP